LADISRNGQALRICKKNEEEVAKSQDPDLRDTFWVVEVSDKEIEENRLENLQIEFDKDNDRYYDSGRLMKCVRKLIKQFEKKVKAADMGKLLNHRTDEIYLLITKQGLSGTHIDDCYKNLEIELFHCNSNWPFRIHNTITLKNGRFYSGGNSSQAICNFHTMDEVLQWLGDEKTPEKVYNHFCKLIDSFYKE
jgi:hypothetical protein